MASKLMSITVKGNRASYCFNFYGDPKHLAEWRAEGLEVDEIMNTVPGWIVEAGLARPWIFLQDCFNFKSPF